ncbi:hypothetical protein CQW23_06477 [Capsicum baccatum]|uniref:Uncharacterized protein n=1 Tax=Capsicum baccatum TaxID=33114 RepID=A0A2G2X3F3_CAPBA|nr:hypothetical protein CQW23_06477 [Capsicum baccatum]
MLNRELDFARLTVHMQQVEEKKRKIAEFVTYISEKLRDMAFAAAITCLMRTIRQSMELWMYAAEIATPANRRGHQARFTYDHQPMQPAFDDDDDDLDGAGATRAIIPPPLAPGAKFNITSTMIQLLQLNGLFGGLAGDDSNMHLINFISICKSFENPGVGQNAI